MQLYASSPRGRTVVRALRLILVVGILAVLVLQVGSIGWRSVLTSLPTTPWFYVLVLTMYFLLPSFELGIYRRMWRAPLAPLLRVLIRKRVLNNEVVGYSGEVYLYSWGRKLAGVDDAKSFAAVKDNAIASSLASNTILVILVTGFVLAGKVVLVDVIGPQNPIAIVVAIAGVAILAATFVRFRRSILSHSARVVGILFGVHCLRFVVMYGLQILQWWVVLPDAPLSVWATMLVVGTLTNRIPFLPARDMFTIGAMLGVSGFLDASQAVVAGMLVTKSAIDKTLNAGLFATTAWIDRRGSVEAEDLTTAADEFSAIEAEESETAKMYT